MIPSIYAHNEELERLGAERVDPPADLVPSWIEVYRHWDDKHGTQAWIYTFRFMNKWANMLVTPKSEKSKLDMRLHYRQAMSQIIIALTYGDEAKPFRKALKISWCRRSEELINEIKRLAATKDKIDARQTHDSGQQGGQEPASGHNPPGTA